MKTAGRTTTNARNARDARGIALLAAVLILFLITALGLIALITSESDVKIVGNLDQGKKMFFLAEQTVDRILNHMHYKDEGLLKLLKIDPLATSPLSSDGKSIVLAPYKVLESKSGAGGARVSPMIVDTTTGTVVTKDDKYWITASIDPKNWRELTYCSTCTSGNCGAAQCGYGRPKNDPFRIIVKVDRMTKSGSNDVVSYSKVFAADVKPKGPLDFAYFVQDMAESIRRGRTGRDVPVKCKSQYPFYNCNTTFHNRGPSSVTCEDPTEGCDYLNDGVGPMIGDYVLGDMYVGGQGDQFLHAVGDRFLVRGRPQFQGELWWKNQYPYRKATDNDIYYSNQTSGGENIAATSERFHPRVAGGIKSYAKSIEFFPRRIQDTIWAPTSAQFYPGLFSNLRGNSGASDIVINTFSTGHRSLKVLFRHDLDSNGDGLREEPQLVKTSWVGYAGTSRYRPGGAVASAITPTLNDGTVNVANEPGYMAMWKIAWGTDWWYRDYEDERRALYGGSIRDRVAQLDKLNQVIGAGTVVPATDLGFGSFSHYSESCLYKTNQTEDPTSDEPKLTYFRVPSQGASCATEPFSGIMLVRGNLILSGVLDGKLSIFVEGDVVFDHELEYEKDPLKYPDDIGLKGDMDMLGLFVRGDVVIPNSIANDHATDAKKIFLDDFSDALNGEGSFAPQGQYDNPLVSEDDGSEDIQAVIMSWGYHCQGATDDPATVCDPTLNRLAFEDEVAAFRVGFYARPRTQGDGVNAPKPTDEPHIAQIFNGLTGESLWFFDPQGNQSGPLRVVGAILEQYSGRVSYDYHDHSDAEPAGRHINATCSRGYTENDADNPALNQGCNTIGHEAFELTYDPRLRFTSPPTPYDYVSSNKNDGMFWEPFGRAAYEVMSWTELPSTTNLAADSW